MKILFLKESLPSAQKNENQSNDDFCNGVMQHDRASVQQVCLQVSRCLHDTLHHVQTQSWTPTSDNFPASVIKIKNQENMLFIGRHS